MGTNFYAYTNRCECCKREDVVHLGKRSGGWVFSFQGSDTVRDFDAWCALVRSAGRIEDEYGLEYTADAMIALAREWQQGKNHAQLYPDGCWVDGNGYSFSGWDFS